ncbi:MAG: GntR family transcriptional regulator [Xanthobacteraceae bacterium]|nr:GntR family transcriptional regulator [Xanthobacteraceae bacterium]
MARSNLRSDTVTAFAPAERETLNDRVYRELKTSIMEGRFKPGAVLTLRTVSDALGTSMMPVRDAMRRLVSERALEVRPSRKIALPVLNAEQFLELRRIRMLLEGEAAARAAERITPRQLGACKALLTKFDGLGLDNPREFWTLNHKLHFTIYEAADSPQLVSIIEMLWLQIGPLLTRIAVTRAVQDAADPHALLVDALERRDGAAARAALEHDLTQSTERVMQELTRLDALRKD